MATLTTRMRVWYWNVASRINNPHRSARVHTSHDHFLGLLPKPNNHTGRKGRKAWAGHIPLIFATALQGKGGVASFVFSARKQAQGGKRFDKSHVAGTSWKKWKPRFVWLQKTILFLWHSIAPEKESSKAMFTKDRSVEQPWGKRLRWPKWARTTGKGLGNARRSRPRRRTEKRCLTLFSQLFPKLLCHRAQMCFFTSHY